MPDDARTVPVTFQVDPKTASALDEPATRAQAEQAIQNTVRKARVDQLSEAIRALKEDARRNGLTDEIIDEELAAYNAERRERPPAA